MKLNSALSQDLINDKQYLWAVLIARNTQGLIGTSIVAIQLPIKESNEALNVFQNAIYRGYVTINHELIISEIQLNALDDEVNIEYKLEDCKFTLI